MPAKLERCVKAVGRSGSAVNPWAVCTASINGKKARVNIAKLKERYGVRTRTPQAFDPHMVEELDVYAENTAELYNQKKSILANLHKKVVKGIYDPTLAAKLWGYWVKNAAARYSKEFDGVKFTKADRDEVAKRLAARYPKGLEE